SIFTSFYLRLMQDSNESIAGYLKISELSMVSPELAPPGTPPELHIELTTRVNFKIFIDFARF
ncbi:MAG: hypothetical protein U9R69_00985, partial [Thermodesulfobacteriota bacterium]|nr:hypothetical protein [Thermodesulfobacteriota bacterium]